MALVFAAYDKQTHQNAAIKILNLEPNASGSQVDLSDINRFKREGEILEKLHHPNIVRILDHGITGDGALYIAMEQIRGESLQEKLNRCELNLRGFTVEESAHFLTQIADALSEAHALGIVHRDIKPSNILINPDGIVKLVDFGLARSIASSQGLTVPGEVLGSGYYMSPEQHAGILVGYSTNFDHRSDIYSLGVLAYALVVGAPPFSELDLTWPRLAALHAQTAIPSCALISKRPIPKWYDRMIEIATAKAPADRFQSARDFGDFLEAHLNAKGFWRGLLQYVSKS